MFKVGYSQSQLERIVSIAGISVILVALLFGAFNLYRIKNLKSDLKQARAESKALQANVAALREESNRVQGLYLDVTDRLNKERLRASERMNELEKALNTEQGKSWGSQKIPKEVLNSIREGVGG